MSVKRKSVNHRSWQSGEKVDLCPETNSDDSALRGKNGRKNLSESLGRRLGSALSSLVSRANWLTASSGIVILLV